MRIRPLLIRVLASQELEETLAIMLAGLILIGFIGGLLLVSLSR